MDITVTEEQLFAKIGRLQVECETRIVRESELVKMIQDLRTQVQELTAEPEPEEPPAKVARSTRK